MIRRYILALAIIPFLSYAQAPEGYYAGTDGLTGYALKTKLHEIISEKVINWNYDDLKTLYGQTDMDKYYDYDANNTTYLLDIYSNNPTGTTAYHYTLANIIGSASAEGLGWNREHMMPQSSFNSNYPMYSDMMFIIPTDARINQLRSNYPYGKAGSTVYYTFTNGSKQASNGTPNATYTGRVYEPVDEFKGDVARSLLYYVVRYEGKLGSFNYSTNADPTKDQNPLDGTEEKAYENWYIAMLLSWNQQDPVSQREIDRNNAVYAIQKNRNPFIDHPEWVNLIWNQTPDSVAPQVPSNLALMQNSAYFVKLQWQASPDADVLGYEIYQNGTLVTKTRNTNIVIDRLSSSTSYTFTVKAYDNGYLKSAESNSVSVTTLDSDIYAKDLMITKYIEGTSSNRALEIANYTGHDVNLQGYRLSAQYKSSGNYYFDSPLELEGTIANNQVFVAINPRANLSCVDINNAKFASAGPALNFSGYNYVEINYKNTTVDGVGTKGIDNPNADKSLYRLASVKQPNTTYDAAEWQMFSKDYCTGLGVLAVNDIANSDLNINIYPNPVTDILNISGDISKVKSAQIFDLSGKLIKNIQMTNQKSIDVHSLLPNTYILSFDGKTIKFIKK